MMRIKLLEVLVLLALFSAPLPVRSADSGSSYNPPTKAQILERVRTEHPRLLLRMEDFQKLKKEIASNPQLKKWDATVLARARQILAAPPSKYEIPDGLRLLATSRAVVDRVYTLGLMYRLHGDKRFLERAWTELDAAAHFPDWNPRHFLDTAEMTHAFGIGYDWLYHDLTEPQRDLLRQAIIQKGLKPAQAVYQKDTWFARAKHNWNQVCNGGIGIGALAIAESDREFAGQILESALRSLPRAMVEFGPDGAWKEGPGYWHYATSYNVAILAALESALGTDFGLSEIPGFSETGLFPIYISGPRGLTFNYADGGDHPLAAPQMFWFAHRFNQPVCAWYQQKMAAPAPQDLIWFDPQAPERSPITAGLATTRYFRGAEVVTMRTKWEDPRALFVGFKGGDNKANHSHLDLGTFVFDADGVRWVEDLGPDDYNLPGYFGGQRWNYYRLRAEGHNTLVINPGAGPDQEPSAKAPITRFQADPDQTVAVADLTAAYAKSARKVTREIALADKRQLLIQDEIQTKAPAEVWWFMHTPAQIELSQKPSECKLTIGAHVLRARILAPANAKFTVMDPKPLPGSPDPKGQRPNHGRKLAIHLEKVTSTRLAVVLSPEA